MKRISRAIIEGREGKIVMMFLFAMIVPSCKDAVKSQQLSRIVAALVPVDVLIISRQYGQSLGFLP